VNFKKAIVYFHCRIVDDFQKVWNMSSKGRKETDGWTERRGRRRGGGDRGGCGRIVSKLLKSH